MIKCMNMRTAIVIFTGITIGIIAGISSANTDSLKTINTDPVIQTFTQPATSSMGIVKDFGKNYIIVSLQGNLVKFFTTKDTNIYGINEFTKRLDVENETPITIDQLLEGIVNVVYFENKNNFFAESVTLLK